MGNRQWAAGCFTAEYRPLPGAELLKVTVTTDGTPECEVVVYRAANGQVQVQTHPVRNRQVQQGGLFD